MTKALRSLPGVANVEIDAAATTATIDVDPAAFSVNDAVDALKSAGFPASQVDDLTPQTDEPAAAETTEPVSDPVPDQPASEGAGESSGDAATDSPAEETEAAP